MGYGASTTINLYPPQTKPFARRSPTESLLDLFVHVDDFYQAWLPPGYEELVQPGQGFLKSAICHAEPPFFGG